MINLGVKECGRRWIVNFNRIKYVIYSAYKEYTQKLLSFNNNNFNSFSSFVHELKTKSNLTKIFREVIQD